MKLDSSTFKSDAQGRLMHQGDGGQGSVASLRLMEAARSDRLARGSCTVPPTLVASSHIVRDISLDAAPSAYMHFAGIQAVRA